MSIPRKRINYYKNILITSVEPWEFSVVYLWWVRNGTGNTNLKHFEPSQISHHGMIHMWYNNFSSFKIFFDRLVDTKKSFKEWKQWQFLLIWFYFVKNLFGISRKSDWVSKISPYFLDIRSRYSRTGLSRTGPRTVQGWLWARFWWLLIGLLRTRWTLDHFRCQQESLVVLFVLVWGSAFVSLWLFLVFRFGRVVSWLKPLARPV